MMDELVLLKTFYSKYDAEVAVGLLKDSGIEAILQGDDVGGYRPHVTLSMGNYRVLVRRAEALQAAEVLKTLEENLSDEEIMQMGEIAVQQPIPAPPEAPKKDAKDIPLVIPFVVIGLFIVIYVLSQNTQRYPAGWRSDHVRCSPAQSTPAEQRICREYYRDDKIRSVWHYEKDLLEGPAKVFHPNGRLKYTEVYSSGKQQGPFSHYYASGALLQEGLFVFGLLEGPVTTYYETGDRMSIVPYKAGERHGELLFLDEGGDVLLRETYQRGVLYGADGQTYQGRRKLHFSNGALREDASFKNGRLSGLRQTFDKKGRLEMEESFRKGKRHGEIKMYYSDGTLKGLYTYRKGKLMSSQEYDRNGRVVFP
jgi:antitoxin component YwqK of YwqJK toxin-antitoxin module